MRVPRQLIKDYANDPNGPKMLALRAQRKHEMQVSFTVLGAWGQIKYDKDIFEKGKTEWGLMVNSYVGREESG